MIQERYYGFGGLELTLSMPADRFFTEERRLAPFGLPDVTDPHTFRFSFVDALSPPEGERQWAQSDLVIYQKEDRQIRYLQGISDRWEDAALRVEHAGKIHQIQALRRRFSGELGVTSALECLSAEYLAVRNRSVILHSSFIQLEDFGILFTAPSETGKSTQAELWRKYRQAVICNGDRSVVRLAGDTVLAEGLPFAGSSEHCLQVSVPLKAIVYLSQAPVTTIQSLRGYEAYRRVWEGCVVNTWNREDVSLASATLQSVLEKIPVYHLACTPDLTAVEALESLLRK